MCYVLVSNGWLDSRSNSNIRKSANVPANGTCLGYGALVNSTTPIRGNGIAKTHAFCLRLPVHELFIVIIKANAIWFEKDAGNRR